MGSALFRTMVAATVVLAACSADTAEPRTAVPVEGSEVGEDFVETVDRIVGRWDGGAAVLSVHDGERTSFALGSANSDGDPMQPDQPFRVGSISKPFVAVMVMQLVDEGRVDLEASLSTYLPDTPVGGSSSVRELLGHDSGIPNYTEQRQFMESTLEDPSTAVTPAEVLGSIEGEESGPVGSYSYSNTNYILLGQLVEAVEGKGLNTVLAERITEPLGLADTFFADADMPAPDDLALGWSQGFSNGDIPVSYRSIATAAWAAGSLISTTVDLHLFLTALLQGDLVSTESLGQMTFTGTDGYGLGLLQVGLGENKLGYGHGGSIFGYSSTIGMDPITGDSVVVITNNDRIVADTIAAQIILEVWPEDG